MNSIRTLKPLVLALLLVLAAVSIGCAPAKRSRFEPKYMPPEEVETALIRTATPLLRGGTDSIRIVTIDGQLPTFLNNTVIVSPGYHYLEIEVEIKKPDPKNGDISLITKILQKLNIYVVAQHEYLVDAKQNGSLAWIWVQDINTGEVIAGQRPV